MNREIKEIINNVLDNDMDNINHWYQFAELNLDVPDTDFDWYVVHPDCGVDFDQVIDRYTVIKTTDYVDQVLKAAGMNSNNCSDKFLETLYDAVKGELWHRAENALQYAKNKIPQDFLLESVGAFQTISTTKDLITYLDSLAPAYQCEDLDFYKDSTMMLSKRISFKELKENPEKYPFHLLYTLKLRNDERNIDVVYDEFYKGHLTAVSIYDRDTSLYICSSEVEDLFEMDMDGERD